MSTAGTRDGCGDRMTLGYRSSNAAATAAKSVMIQMLRLSTSWVNAVSVIGAIAGTGGCGRPPLALSQSATCGRSRLRSVDQKNGPPGIFGGRASPASRRACRFSHLPLSTMASHRQNDNRILMPLQSFGRPYRRQPPLIGAWRGALRQPERKTPTGQYGAASGTAATGPDLGDSAPNSNCELRAFADHDKIATTIPERSF